MAALLSLLPDRVCVPIDPSKVASFDPAKVPTVGLLLRELGEAQRRVESAASAASMEVDSEDATPRKKGDARICGQSQPRPAYVLAASSLTFVCCDSSISDWRDTSLRPYVEMLDRHNLALMKQTRDKKRSTFILGRDSFIERCFLADCLSCLLTIAGAVTMDF